MINIEQVNKSLLGSELELLLNKFVTKHATKPEQFIAKNTPEYTARLSLPHVKSGVHFFDARFPEADPIGAMYYEVGNSNPEYRISSRLIDNNRHRWNRIENTSFRTKDINKALKNAMEYIDIWDMREFVVKSKDISYRKHRIWVEEMGDSQWKLRPGNRDMVKELKNLQAMGYDFITEEFKQAVANLPKYEEYQRRCDETPYLQCVLEVLGKIYLVPQDNGGNLKDAVEYSGLDALPEKVKNNVSLLKITANGEYIPNVGYKSDSNTYWVYEKDVL